MNSTSPIKPEVTWGVRGDILLCNYWQERTDTVVDVHIINCDASSYDSTTIKKAS